MARLRRLPVLQGFPVDAVPRSPYPDDSELYCAIRCGFAQSVTGTGSEPVINVVWMPPVGPALWYVICIIRIV